MKICKKCGKEKEDEKFYSRRNLSKKRGLWTTLASWCKDCSKEGAGASSRRSIALTAEKKLKHRNMIATLKAGPCADCGGTFHPVCMDFDHVDPATKTRNVSAMAQQATETILEEIAKCELVCANCHRIRSSKLLGYFYESHGLYYSES